MGQRFHPCKILEPIRAGLQPLFVWEDRWVLRSLPLAAVAGITGQALMVGGIASCCISNNEQWQALRRHNKSQATLETPRTGPGSVLSLLHGVGADEQADWLAAWPGADYLYHSFIDAALLSQSTPFRYLCTLISMYNCRSGILGSHWLLYWQQGFVFVFLFFIFLELLLFRKDIIIKCRLSRWGGLWFGLCGKL